MSYYLKSQEVLWPTAEGQYDVRDALPVGTYTVGAHPEKGWYLKPITEFQITGKIYGNTTERAERILNTFDNRPSSTGVLLNGEKGSGKTMLAKMISQKAAEQGISTLVINTPFTGDGFNTFIQQIDEPCVIVFDEFEKVFDEEQQEATLTLLDGVYPSKKLFILTVNDKYRVNQHMRNRPGRIFYSIEYKGLDAAFIEEYCNDVLDNKSHIPQIVRLTLMFESFNFDMLKALVEEMNRYKESPNQALEMLNAKPADNGHARHHISAFRDGKELDAGTYWPNQYRGSPLAQDEFTMGFDVVVDEDGGPSTSDEVLITQANLKKIDAEDGTFTYIINEDKPNTTVIVFTRENFNKKQYNWLDAF
jgi:hypothetical protein